MGKRSIKALEDTISAARAQLLKLIGAKYPEVPALSLEEKIAQLTDGRAVFKYDMFSGPTCPYNPILWSCFEFEGEAEREGKNAAIKRERAKAIDVADNAVSLLHSYLITGVIPEEEQSEAFKALFNQNYYWMR